MPTCVKGHESDTEDYCDHCGSPLEGAGAPAAEVADGPAPTDAGSAQSCPQCGATRTGRFCEADGYDFVVADLGGTQPPHGSAGGPDADRNVDHATATRTAEQSPAEGDANVNSGGGAEPTGEPVGCRVSVSADRDYHERVRAMGGPDADALAFPEFCPERHFRFTGRQVLIGRRSRTRGVEPQIDLTGPPEDPGVSHTHAVLVPAEGGSWSVVDLGSSNGTYLNGSDEPLLANTPTVLQDGDRIHVGAWTTLTYGTGAAES